MRGIDGDLAGDILGAALGDHGGFAATDVDLERPVGVEEWRTRSDLQQRTGWMHEFPTRVDDLHTCLDRLTSRLVDDLPSQFCHVGLLYAGAITMLGRSMVQDGRPHWGRTPVAKQKVRWLSDQRTFDSQLGFSEEATVHHCRRISRSFGTIIGVRR